MLVIKRLLYVYLVSTVQITAFSQITYILIICTNTPAAKIINIQTGQFPGVNVQGSAFFILSVVVFA